jgi:hypothetical protein
VSRPLPVPALALAAGLVVLAVPVEAVRVIAAVPLCFATGYALVAALGPRQVDGPTRALLMVALSLATLAVLAVLLSGIAKLDRVTWTAGLIAVVVLASSAGPVPPVRLPRRPTRLRARESLLIGGCVAALGSALVVSRTTFAARDVAGYTQLWMLPDPATRQLAVGFQSAELRTTRYFLEVRLGGLLLRRYGPVALRPGERFERALGIRDVPGLSAVLYRADVRGGPYRRVTRPAPATVHARSRAPQAGSRLSARMR